MGKRIHRRKHFHPIAPVPVGANEHYAIISHFHGGAHKHCTVKVYDTEESALLKEPMLVKLKGSLKPKKTKSQLVVGSFVRISFGEISLVYQPGDATYIIPNDIRQALFCSISSDVIQSEEVQFEIQPDRMCLPDSASSDESDDDGGGLINGNFM